MKPVHICLALMAASLVLATAQADERPGGKWATWVDGRGVSSASSKKVCAVDDAMLGAWFNRLRSIPGQLKMGTVVVPPEYHTRWSAQWQGEDGALCRKGPLRGTLRFAPYHDKLLGLNARTGELEARQSTSTLTLHVNEIRGLTVLPWPMEENEPEIGTARITGRFAGFPVVEEKYALITPPGMPEPLVPAPAELVLRRWIARGQQDLDGMEPLVKAGGSPPESVAAVARMRKGLERARTMLAKLDANTRHRAIWLRQDGLFDELVLDPSGDAAQVMWANPQFFAKATNRSGVYLFSVAVWELASQGGATEVNRKMAEAIDWQALARGLP